MLKTVSASRSAKTAGCAVTYRAGAGNRFGTCPATCALNPTGKGAGAVDTEYLAALLDAVPRRGVAFTYSHFPFAEWAGELRAGRTVINYSADDLDAADTAHAAGVPAVTVMSPAAWGDSGRNAATPAGVPVVRCPAEMAKGFSCSDCGNGEPLCSRLGRNFVIGFTAHGPGKRAAAAGSDDPGGCYADAGNCRIHWTATAQAGQDESDSQAVRKFARRLPPGSILRHHVAGDIGAD
jgi:hypothetical protein